jgi:DNA processing protein
MDTSQTARNLLALLKIPGIGSQTAIRLMHAFSSWDWRYGPPDTTNETQKTLLKKISSESLRKACEDADRDLDVAKNLKVSVVSYFDEQYPALMREISDAPAIIYVKGSLRPELRCVACVGTREPSHFGKEVAKRLTTFLASHNYSIVSGLALGIDTISHEAALGAGRHTIAILANGLDTVYPSKNRKLADLILDSGGAIISEQPFKSKAFATQLVQRDRLQSGMSVATFVMQTDIIGGTMHTVKFTLMQNRLLFAPVPPARYAEEPKCRGIRAITEMTGTELANSLQATGKYRELLTTKYANIPPATPITDRNQYESILLAISNYISYKGEEAPMKGGLFVD